MVQNIVLGSLLNDRLLKSKVRALHSGTFSLGVPSPSVVSGVVNL